MVGEIYGVLDTMLKRVITFLRVCCDADVGSEGPVDVSGGPPPPLEEFEEHYNPYANDGWYGTQWHCIRCGYRLDELPPSDDQGWTWRAMQHKGYLLYRCSNVKCFHHTGYLTLHHPHSTNRGPGESYSVSWIR